MSSDGHHSAHLKAEAAEKARKLQAKAAGKADKLTGSQAEERQHSPELDKKTKEETDSPDAVWLHGTLKVHIIGARGLPRHRMMLSFRKNLGGCMNSCLGGTEKTVCGVRPARAYATVDLGPARRARTRIIKTTTHPQWDERFSILVADKVRGVGFTIKDANIFSSPAIGQARLPVAEIAPGKVFEGWLELVDDQGKTVQKGDVLRTPAKTGIHVKVEYIPVEKDPDWGHGLGQGELMGSVPATYFPLRKGCRLTLYNDAHQDPDWQPQIQLDNGKLYKAGGAWDDLYQAILNAKHVIYITGWSLFDKIHLRRDANEKPQDGRWTSLGEMLKQKAAEGVRVCIMIWDDKTSLNAPFLKTDGLMMVHDEDTKDFFADSKVHVRLVPRNAGGKDDSWVYYLQKGSMFTHHQKSVVMDAAPVEGVGQGSLRLIAFIGGLDLCDGRYDDRKHWLFRTLHNEHHLDYHQACIKGACIEKGGPRQPWHDIHARVEGPIVWDVLTNFTQRWKKQAGRTHQRDLLNLQKVPGLFLPARHLGITTDHQGDAGAFAGDPNDRESWCMQLFRSIDTTSAVGVPSTHSEAYAGGFSSGKGRMIEFSIQQAFVTAIRRAQRFLYIESQYFIGSAHAWLDYINGGGAINLIPVEIALKIASKIRARERFVAYILLPMWPEGFPESGSVQEVLYFQTQTIRMMYKIVADAMRDVGNTEEHPRDYLIFTTIGNREPKVEGEVEPQQKVPEGQYKLCQDSRRFMIYVHSKFCVVDDEYALVGSSNINQRSMDGARDTEICAGAFQPAYTHHTAGADAPTVKGEIYGFRMSVWEEHMNTLRPSFERPESLECVREVAALCQVNWERFNQEEICELPGHLMPYPFQVTKDGEVVAMEEHDGNFPDTTNAPVLGGPRDTLPDMLTS
ncbi:hypothetical protein WJX73_007251 [Symbiochloris irregularis]|uniref:Phospholipase D n=1 Tax=Symbiochloris irregularis TaxID=706552 RepID=A0AAW1P1N1_9CHLO